jgi:hypothetical protein
MLDFIFIFFDRGGRWRFGFLSAYASAGLALDFIAIFL